ncbi:MAG: hypothetical protein JST96_19170 [Bacteroidetes bacterium]|nr:hypothetical protein [Bacteroidota bacterium]
MKIFLYIFSLYILLLSAIPCCAIGNCNDSKLNKSEQQKDAGKNDACGNCSPFATCGNCTGFTAKVSIIIMNKPQQVTRGVFVHCPDDPLEMYIPSFWQPPRLG